MSEIHSLSEYRRKKQQKSDVEIMRERFLPIVRGLNDEWLHAKRWDRLDEFVAEHLEAEEDEYTSDLNLLNQIETGIGIRTIVFHPYAVMAGDLTGFAAGFKYKDELFATPSMVTEGEARAFNVLLYLRMMTDGIRDH